MVEYVAPRCGRLHLHSRALFAWSSAEFLCLAPLWQSIDSFEKALTSAPLSRTQIISERCRWSMRCAKT